MTKQILGKQIVDYFSKKNNRQVTGVTLHCAGNDTRVEGLGVETIYIPSVSSLYADVMNMPLGTEIVVGYNRWGSVDTVSAVKK